MPSHILPILNLRGAKLLLASGTIFGASLAQGDVIYQQGFENSWTNADGLWSSSTNASLGGVYTNVLGRFGSQTINLNVLATADNNGGFGGGNPDGNPFNLTVERFVNNRDRIPHLDQSGGGGSGGNGDPGTTDAPYINLGEAIRDQNSSNGPPMFGPGTYALRFDLMLFDSWDGSFAAFGPDSFNVSVNGETLFDEMLFGVHYLNGVNFRAPDETPGQNVYNPRWVDSIYRDIVLEFELTDAMDHLAIDFTGILSQSLNDESWGLDNVLIEQVSTNRSVVVPAPGTLVLLGSGLGLMARRKREV